MRPQYNDYPEYFENYIPLVRQSTIVEAITETKKQALHFIKAIDPTLENFAYAEGKWTVKEVLIHITDTHRIFDSRALAFARGEKQRALSFDENDYAANCNAQTRTLYHIAEEFECVANASFHLYQSFSEDMLNRKGEFPAGFTTVNAIGFTTCGHTLHHINVLKQRYLKN